MGELGRGGGVKRLRGGLGVGVGVDGGTARGILAPPPQINHPLPQEETVGAPEGVGRAVERGNRDRCC